MNSHEYANKLKGLAEFLLSKSEFEVRDGDVKVWFWYFAHKDQFLSAAKALGAGTKRYSGSDMDFIPSGLPEGSELFIRVDRSAVCRKVQDEKWECEPLLSQEEESQIGAQL